MRFLIVDVPWIEMRSNGSNAADLAERIFLANAPPEDRRKSRFKTHLADVLTQTGDFDPPA